MYILLPLKARVVNILDPRNYVESYRILLDIINIAAVNLYFYDEILSLFFDGSKGDFWYDWSGGRCMK